MKTRRAPLSGNIYEMKYFKPFQTDFLHLSPASFPPFFLIFFISFLNEIVSGCYGEFNEKEK